MRGSGEPRDFAGRFRTRFRSLRERHFEQRHFRAMVVLVAGLGLAAAGFAALGPSLGAFTATVSSQAEVGVGSLDLALDAPSPASSPTSCTADAGNTFVAKCSGAEIAQSAAPSQSYSADWLASSSGTITPQNDPGFSFSLTHGGCSGSNTTVCDDTEATVDELSAEPNVATPLPGSQSSTSPYSFSSSYELFSVSCPSTTICVATGSTSASSDYSGVIVTSNDGGATWSPPTLPTGLPAGTTTSFLPSVSCPTTTSCVAVGYVGFSNGSGEPLSETGTYDSSTETWSWTPTTISGTEFVGVSCFSNTSDCVAVGNTSAGFVAWTTTDVGGSWSASTTPLNSAPTSGNYSLIVSCAGSAAAPTCVALWNPSTPSSTAYAMAYVGTIPSGGTGLGSLAWSTNYDFPTPGDTLDGVSCPSTSSCVVVGSNSGSSPTAAAADTFSISSGSGTWGSTPATPSGMSQLVGVACTSTSDCAAVGVGLSNNDATSTTNDGGTSWSAADQFASYNSPNVDQDQGGLLSVVCPSATQCVAVGFDGSATSTNSGQSWVGYEPLECVFPPPPPSSNSNSNRNGTCSFSSTYTLESLGTSGSLTLQPSSLADPGVLIEVSTELASSASTSDEGATASVSLTFTATA